MATDASSPAKATRRPRGAPRLLLLDAARTLFARQDYRSTTTREIADTAGVLEHLLFRQFGSKASLFNESVVVPFLRIVDDLNGRWDFIEPGPASSEAVAREFLGALYDLFMDNRGLVMTLWTADALTDEELQETGIIEIDRALGILGHLGGKAFDILGMDADHQDLAARSTVAMVAPTDRSPDRKRFLVLASAHASMRLRPSGSVRPRRWANTAICKAIAIAS
jgi:AcrR family transcriptional regulator